MILWRKLVSLMETIVCGRNKMQKKKKILWQKSLSLTETWTETCSVKHTIFLAFYTWFPGKSFCEKWEFALSLITKIITLWSPVRHVPDQCTKYPCVPCIWQVYHVPDQFTIYLANLPYTWPVYHIPDQCTFYLTSVPSTWPVSNVPRRRQSWLFPTNFGPVLAVLDYLRLYHGYLPPMHCHIVMHCRWTYLTSVPCTGPVYYIPDQFTISLTSVPCTWGDSQIYIPFRFWEVYLQNAL